MFSRCTNLKVHKSGKRLFEPHNAMECNMRVVAVIYKYRSNINYMRLFSFSGPG